MRLLLCKLKFKFVSFRPLATAVPHGRVSGNPRRWLYASSAVIFAAGVPLSLLYFAPSFIPHAKPAIAQSQSQSSPTLQIVAQDPQPSSINYENFEAKSEPGTFTVVLRALRLVILFAPAAFLFPLARFWAWFEGKDSGGYPRWWIRLFVWTLESAGPTFVKLGQYLSTRRDYLPQHATALLATLQSNAPISPLPLSRATSLVQSAFPELPPLELSPTPIGAGAIAQVYVSTDRELALKLLRPNVREQIRSDLVVLGVVARFVDDLRPSWGVREEFNMFKGMMMAQTNLKTEAKALITFRDGVVCSLRGVRVPKVIASAQGVLAEEFVEGVPVERFWGREETEMGREIVELCLDAFVAMVLDNFVHVDMHPGNVLVTFEKPNPAGRNKPPISPPRDLTRALCDPTVSPELFTTAITTIRAAGYKPVLTLLDAGLTSTLSPSNHSKLLDLVSSLARSDPRGVAQVFEACSHGGETKAFGEDVGVLVEGLMRGGWDARGAQGASVLMEVFEMARRRGVRLDGGFANIVVGALVLEGTVSGLCDRVDLVQALRQRVLG